MMFYDPGNGLWIATAGTTTSGCLVHIFNCLFSSSVRGAGWQNFATNNAQDMYHREFAQPDSVQCAGRQFEQAFTALVN